MGKLIIISLKMYGQMRHFSWEQSFRPRSESPKFSEHHCLSQWKSYLLLVIWGLLWIDLQICRSLTYWAVKMTKNKRFIGKRWQMAALPHRIDHGHTFFSMTKREPNEWMDAGIWSHIGLIMGINLFRWPSESRMDAGIWSTVSLEKQSDGKQRNFLYNGYSL